jgi:hypothetical protein
MRRNAEQRSGAVGIASRGTPLEDPAAPATPLSGCRRRTHQPARPKAPAKARWLEPIGITKSVMPIGSAPHRMKGAPSHPRLWARQLGVWLRGRGRRQAVGETLRPPSGLFCGRPPNPWSLWPHAWEGRPRAGSPSVPRLLRPLIAKAGGAGSARTVRGPHSGPRGGDHLCGLVHREHGAD